MKAFRDMKRANKIEFRIPFTVLSINNESSTTESHGVTENEIQRFKFKITAINLRLKDRHIPRGTGRLEVSTQLTGWIP